MARHSGVERGGGGDLTNEFHFHPMARHELLTIKTMAEQGGEIYRRAIKLTTFASPEGLERMKGCARPV